jgi:hypothetical protein
MKIYVANYETSCCVLNKGYASIIYKIMFHKNSVATMEDGLD